MPKNMLRQITLCSMHVSNVNTRALLYTVGNWTFQSSSYLYTTTYIYIVRL